MGKQDWKALQYATEDLRGDRDIVLEAMQQSLCALQMNRHREIDSQGSEEWYRRVRHPCPLVCERIDTEKWMEAKNRNWTCVACERDAEINGDSDDFQAKYFCNNRSCKHGMHFTLCKRCFDKRNEFFKPASSPKCEVGTWQVRLGHLKWVIHGNSEEIEDAYCNGEDHYRFIDKDYQFVTIDFHTCLQTSRANPQGLPIKRKNTDANPEFALKDQVEVFSAQDRVWIPCDICGIHDSSTSKIPENHYLISTRHDRPFPPGASERVRNISMPMPVDEIRRPWSESVRPKRAPKQRLGGAAHVLVYAAVDLMSDRAFMLEAVKLLGDTLRYATSEVKCDREVVLEAVRQQGCALEFAAEELKFDREVVLESVKQDGRSLKYATQDLKRDREIVLHALRNIAFVDDVWREVAHELRDDPMVKEAGASRFAIATSKRIAYHGRITDERGGKCIASFPGKYAEKWEWAVSEKHSNSVGCVFLTDQASGLGQHVKDDDDPEAPCLCRRLYGKVMACSYMSVLDKPNTKDAAEMHDYGKMLAFKQADAKAMGQIFIEEAVYNTSDEFEAARQKAKKDAARLCDENQHVAPWGCSWFDAWKENIMKAVELNQELIVYYFEGKTGRGKVPWHQLADLQVVQKAREGGGLGASQTAEVAWLDHMQFRYTERDVCDVPNE